MEVHGLGRNNKPRQWVLFMCLVIFKTGTKLNFQLGCKKAVLVRDNLLLSDGKISIPKFVEILFTTTLATSCSRSESQMQRAGLAHQGQGKLRLSHLQTVSSCTSELFGDCP